MECKRFRGQTLELLVGKILEIWANQAGFSVASPAHGRTLLAFRSKRPFVPLLNICLVSAGRSHDDVQDDFTVQRHFHQEAQQVVD
jgi:hypothetical protein